MMILWASLKQGQTPNFVEHYFSVFIVEIWPKLMDINIRTILRSIECHEKLESLVFYLFFSELDFIDLFLDSLDNWLLSFAELFDCFELLKQPQITWVYQLIIEMIYR